MKFCEFFKFSEFSDVWFNLTSPGLNLTLHKVTSHERMGSQIDARWDLMSHQSEILYSLIFLFVYRKKKTLHFRSVYCELLNSIFVLRKRPLCENSIVLILTFSLLRDTSSPTGEDFQFDSIGFQRLSALVQHKGPKQQTQRVWQTRVTMLQKLKVTKRKRRKILLKGIFRCVVVFSSFHHARHFCEFRDPRDQLHNSCLRCLPVFTFSWLLMQEIP